MKIGAMNNPRKDVVDEVKLIGEQGFDYVDLTIEYPQAMPEQIRTNMKGLKDTLSTYNLGLVGHMPWFLNIIHPYESVRAAIIAECDTIFKMCQELGIEHVTIHPDYMKLRREQKELVAETIKSMRTLSANAQAHGLTLCLENFEEEYFSVDNIKQILSSVDSLKFTLDIGHAYMKVKKTANVLSFISELAPYINHVHMHDNHGFRDEHLPLGVGTIEFPRIIEALKAQGYDRTVTLEVHADDREYLQISKRKLRGMWDGTHGN
jgi:sugar phosphate isomerase/epimerase